MRTQRPHLPPRVCLQRRSYVGPRASSKNHRKESMASFRLEHKVRILTNRTGVLSSVFSSVRGAVWLSFPPPFSFSLGVGVRGWGAAREAPHPQARPVDVHLLTASSPTSTAFQTSHRCRDTSSLDQSRAQSRSEVVSLRKGPTRTCFPFCNVTARISGGAHAYAHQSHC